MSWWCSGWPHARAVEHRSESDRSPSALDLDGRPETADVAQIVERLMFWAGGI